MLQHQVLSEMWKFDKEKIGYVKTDDFHGALQIALDIKKVQSTRLLCFVPYSITCVDRKKRVLSCVRLFHLLVIVALLLTGDGWPTSVKAPGSTGRVTSI